MRDLSRDNDFLSLNTTTVRGQAGLLDIIDAVARAGIPGISPWRDQTQACGIEIAAKSIKANGLRVSGYCRGGWFTTAGRAGFKATVDDNRRAIDEAATLGAQCLVMVVGGLPERSRNLPGARALVRDCLAEVLPYAITAGVPLALEPLRCTLRNALASIPWLRRTICATNWGPGLASHSTFIMCGGIRTSSAR
jgi:sugar phosphate isomerase/epimerase